MMCESVIYVKVILYDSALKICIYQFFFVPLHAKMRAEGEHGNRKQDTKQRLWHLPGVAFKKKTYEIQSRDRRNIASGG